MPAPKGSRGSGGYGLPPWLAPIGDRLTPAVRALVIIETITFVIYLFAPVSVRYLSDQYLALGPSVMTGMVWQPVTGLFVNNDFLGYLFPVIGLWFVGADIELNRGQRYFLRLFFLPGIAGGFTQVLAGSLLGQGGIVAGAALPVLALFVGSGVSRGRMPVRILGGLFMEARTFSALILGLHLLSCLMQGAMHMLIAALVASGLAAFLAGGRPRDVQNLFRRGKKARSRYVVLDGGKKDRKPDTSGFIN
jgi:membrane associated rhomboid family serine protease